MQKPETVYFENRHGVRVTDRFVSTKFKDEALAPVESVQVGREFLLIALICGGALLASAHRFRDLLYIEEQLALVCVAALMIVISACIAPLRIGRYAYEKTILWANIWTVNAVRRAIAEAKHTNRSEGRSQAIYD